jgi:hypothetical protein
MEDRIPDGLWSRCQIGRRTCGSGPGRPGRGRFATPRVCAPVAWGGGGAARLGCFWREGTPYSRVRSYQPERRTREANDEKTDPKHQ